MLRWCCYHRNRQPRIIRWRPDNFHLHCNGAVASITCKLRPVGTGVSRSSRFASRAPDCNAPVVNAWYYCRPLPLSIATSMRKSMLRLLFIDLAWTREKPRWFEWDWWDENDCVGTISKDKTVAPCGTVLDMTLFGYAREIKIVQPKADQRRGLQEVGSQMRSIIAVDDWNLALEQYRWPGLEQSTFCVMHTGCTLRKSTWYL